MAESTLKSWELDPKKYLLVGREISEKFLGDPNYYDLVVDSAIVLESSPQPSDHFLKAEVIRAMAGLVLKGPWPT